MKQQIMNLLKLLTIMYDKQTPYHDNTCYRDLEDLRKIENYNVCLRQGCTHIDFCMQLNKIMNELNKIEHKECEHNFVHDIIGDSCCTSSRDVKRMKCLKCNIIRYM